MRVMKGIARTKLPSTLRQSYIGLMASSAERPQARRFNIVGIIGVLVVLFIGVLVRLTTGWSPWITYGVPFIILFLVTLPLALAAGRERAQIRKAESEAEPESDR